MEIYLKDVPTEVRRIINSANKMVTLNNGGMNATTSNASGEALLRDFECGCTGQDLADFQGTAGCQLCGSTDCIALCYCTTCLWSHAEEFINKSCSS